MKNGTSNHHTYNPPFFLQKLYNYQKAIYQRKGHWTQKEKVKYGVFLEVFRQKFQDKQNPILNKMFRVMSDFIKTRNHNQCRSHHQKMERQRFEIDSILQSIKSKYHPRQYELFYEKYTKHIKTLNIDVVLQQKGFTPHKNIQKRKKRTQTLKNQFQCKKEIQRELDYDSVINIKQVDSIDKQIIHYSFNQQQDHLDEQRGKLIINENIGEHAILADKYNAGIEIDNSQRKEGHQINIKYQNQKGPKRTAIQYQQDDQDHQNQKVNVAILQIPIEALMQAENKGRLNMKSIPLTTGQSSIYQYMPNYQNSLNQPFSLNSANLEHGYLMQIKQLQEQKRWNLNQANKYYNSMNEHLQRANACQQSKQMVVKSLMEIKSRYFFQNSLAPQF